jgi:hypothetical protein
LTTYKLDNLLDLHNKGWIRVNTKDGRLIDLPYSTQITKLKNSFNIIDGFYKNTEIELSSKQVGLYVRKQTTQASKIGIALHSSIKTLEIPKIGKFQILFEKDKIPLGRYKILIPFYPHDKNPKIHSNEEHGGSRFASTWFQLTNSKFVLKDTFLHLGTYSEGCLTIPYVKGKNSGKNWNKLYFALINSRIDNHSLAYLNVVV